VRHAGRDGLFHGPGLDAGWARDVLRAVFYPPGESEIHVAGVTPHPNAVWMVQVARRKSLRVRHHWCKDTVEYFDSTGRGGGVWCAR
jgi:hypothetical protein